MCTIFPKIRRAKWGMKLEWVYNLRSAIKGAVAERLRYRSREQKVPSSSPRSDISVEVTSQC